MKVNIVSDLAKIPVELKDCDFFNLPDGKLREISVFNRREILK